jgi:hypothetical protein
MRTLRLARIAAEAEGLRLRHRAKRTAFRVALGVVAAAFLLGAVAFAHIAVWYWLRSSWQPQFVALTLAGADLLVAVLLGLLASRSAPDRTELEALAVRQRALEGAAGSIAWSALALEVLRIAGSLLSRFRPRG